MMLSLIIIIGFLLCVFIEKYRKHSRQTKIKEAVAYILTSNFRYLINKIQNSLNIDEHLKITSEEEWETINIIIGQFKEDTKTLYFNNNLPFPDNKSLPGKETYYLYALCDYLNSHQCDTRFSGNKMHKKTLEYKTYGSWGETLYDAKYELTDFAVTFNKLYYISYLYCKSNKRINPKNKHYFNDKSIKRIIESKTISISRL